MSIRHERKPSVAEEQALEVVYQKLQQDAALGIGEGIVGWGNPRLEAMRMRPDKRDTTLARGQHTQKDLEEFPSNEESLHRYGQVFLQAIGLDPSSDEARYSYAREHGYLRMHGDVTHQPSRQQDITIVVTKRGFHYRESISEGLRAGGVQEVLERPEKLEELVENNDHIGSLIEEQDMGEHVRVLYEPVVFDNLDNNTIYSYLDFMDILARFCSNGRIHIAEPLASIEIATKERYGRRGRGTSQAIVLTEGVPEGYVNLDTLYRKAEEQEDFGEMIHLSYMIKHLEQMLFERLPEEYEETPFGLTMSEVFMNDQGEIWITDFFESPLPERYTQRGGRASRQDDEGDDGDQFLGVH